MTNILDTLAELNKDIPKAVFPSVQMEEPNQSLELYKGFFEIGLDKSRCQLQGTLTFNWFPHQNVSFTGEVVRDADKLSNDFFNEDLSIYLNGMRCGSVLLTRRFIGENQILEGICDDYVDGDGSIKVMEVQFSLPNFRKFLGVTITSEDHRKLTKGRIILEDELQTILLDKVFDYDERFDKLSRKGGFLILYGGKIVFKKTSIAVADLQDLLGKVNLFLSFLNGRRIALFFLKGVTNNGHAWIDYSCYHCDDYETVFTWSQPMAPLSFNEMWNRFSQLWKVPTDRQFLQMAINWYIEANSGSGLAEGRIILTQTGLELLYNWLIVENRKMIMGKDAEDIAAANKLRLLLSQLNVASSIPDAFLHMQRYSDGKKDGPDALVGIRNTLVHGNKNKRADLLKLDSSTISEALQLGIWYMELSILFILGYQGKYHNRAKDNRWRNQGEDVPWA